MAQGIFSLALCILLVAPTFSTNVHEQCQFGIDPAKQAAKATNSLTMKLFEKVSKPEENLVFSPVSIALALALIESGTSGDTRSEIQRHLAPEGSNQLDSSKLYESLQRQLQIKGEAATLNIANGFFYSDEITVKQDFINHTKKCFETQVEKQSFKANSEEARRHINQWISEKTAQKIPELFKTGSIDGQTVAVLANALYLKAAWDDRFEQMENLPFYKLGRDQAQTVSFVHQQRKYPYAENDKVQLVEIPYKGPLAMRIVLPKRRTGFQDLATLTRDEWRSLHTGLTSKTVNLKFPKFTVRSSVNLKDILQKMGISKIFTNQADFTRLAVNPVKVSSAVHEAFIKVNENGTEAAAATGFSIVPLMAETPQTPVQFIADHPFGFSIMHKPTGVIVFAGSVVKIDQE